MASDLDKRHFVRGFADAIGVRRITLSDLRWEVGKKMSVPLRVAACATAMALTLTPDIAGSAAAISEPTVVRIHRHDDQLRRLGEYRRLRHKHDLLRRRHERHLALLRL